MKEWIKVIEVEPMTCAMILRHANSSAMGMQVEITAVDRAIVMLGKNTVSGLVASEVVRKSFTAVEDMGFKLEEFWLHNLAVGYSAHLLSLAVATDGEAQGETIATAGLDDEARSTQGHQPAQQTQAGSGGALLHRRHHARYRQGCDGELLSRPVPHVAR